MLCCILYRLPHSIASPSKSAFLTQRGTETKRNIHREANADRYAETGNMMRETETKTGWERQKDERVQKERGRARVIYMLINHIDI